VVAGIYSRGFICAMDDLTKDELLYLRAKGIVWKRLRIKKGYDDNQEAFANDHGFSRSRYQRIESGTSMSDISNLRLLDHHDMKMADFFFLVDKEYEKLKNNPNSNNLKAI
jgi:hypothetical protein